MSQRYIPSTPLMLLRSSTEEFPLTWYVALELVVVTTEPLGLSQSAEPATVQQSAAGVTHRRAVDAVFMIWSSATMPWLITALPPKYRP